MAFLPCQSGLAFLNVINNRALEQPIYFFILISLQQSSCLLSGVIKIKTNVLHCYSVNAAQPKSEKDIAAGCGECTVCLVSVTDGGTSCPNRILGRKTRNALLTAPRLAQPAPETNPLTCPLHANTEIYFPFLALSIRLGNLSMRETIPSSNKKSPGISDYFF